MLKFVGSNPSTVYWMDTFFTFIRFKNLILFEKTKINEKEAGDGQFFLKKMLI